MSSTGQIRPHILFWLLAGLSILFVLPSARLWFQTPLTLIEFEFEYFLGLFANRDGDSQLAIIAADKLIHFFGFLFIGTVYALCVEEVRRHPDLYSWQFLILFSTLLCVTFTLAMPWVSPDVFFYIGMGWLDGHYGLSPYLHSMSVVPGFTSEEMFNNVYPGFLYGPTSYGPLFQWIAKGIALLSNGSEVVALALHKGLYLVVHAGASLLLIRLVPAASAKWVFVFFACNPLILFSILACTHNDHLMTLFVLLAFAMRQAKRPLLCGAALGAAFAIKYIPLLLLPLFLLDLLMDKTARVTVRERIGSVAALTGGFLITVMALYLLYPEGAIQFLRVMGIEHWLQHAGAGGNVSAGGIGVYRNSIYHLLAFSISYADQKIIFLAAYLLLLSWLMISAGRGNTFPLAGASLGSYLLYFLLLNQTNQEWYLTWIIPFIPLIGTAATRLFSYQMSAIFMPIIIFTIKNPPAGAFVANILGYMVILCFSALLLLRSLTTMNPDKLNPAWLPGWMK